MLLVFWQCSQMSAAQKTDDVIMATPDPKIFQQFPLGWIHLTSLLPSKKLGALPQLSCEEGSPLPESHLAPPLNIRMDGLCMC